MKQQFQLSDKQQHRTLIPERREAEAPGHCLGGASSCSARSRGLAEVRRERREFLEAEVATMCRWHPSEEKAAQTGNSRVLSSFWQRGPLMSLAKYQSVHVWEKNLRPGEKKNWIFFSQWIQAALRVHVSHQLKWRLLHTGGTGNLSKRHTP